MTQIKKEEGQIWRWTSDNGQDWEEYEITRIDEAGYTWIVPISNSEGSIDEDDYEEAFPYDSWEDESTCWELVEVLDCDDEIVVEYLPASEQEKPENPPIEI